MTLESENVFHTAKLCSSVSREFADKNLNVFQMKVLVFECRENFVGKIKNAFYLYFLLFPECFHKPCIVTSLTHSHTMTPFDAPGKQAF